MSYPFNRYDVGVCRLLLAGICSIYLLSCDAPEPSDPGKTTQQQTAGIADSDIANEVQGENWLAYGRTHNERRYSPLDQVDLSNVADLKVDWFLDLPDKGGIVSTPLVVDGVIYFVGSLNIVRAVDAVSGELLWTHDPELGAHFGTSRKVGWTHNRGLSLYGNKIYQATWDGRLIAIDADSGERIWSKQTFDPGIGLYITGAPKAFKGKVLIGNGGTEHGATRGSVSAYDAETGEKAWTFYIVPGNPADGFENEAMEMAAKTWSGKWWEHGGGGNAWNAFTYDEELDQLYIGTGNGSPWNPRIRSPEGGDNLFLSSVVALNPDTGEYIWHYQTTPGEAWDFNSNMDIILADIEIDDAPVKAILHAPKNGFFYVINRVDGKLISAEPFTKTTWASHIDIETGRPVEIPGARYEEGEALIYPSAWGAHSWHAMSYSPKTGLAYIPTIRYGNYLGEVGIDTEAWQSPRFRLSMGATWRGNDADDIKDMGLLQAWDPVKQEQVWSVPMVGRWNAGTMVTAGDLVFQGRATGELIAYDAATGVEAWRFNVGSGISAPPVTYSVDGKQYIAILIGWGGGAAGAGGSIATSFGWPYGVHPRRLITFSLDGSVELPGSPPAQIVQPIPDQNMFSVDDGLADKGGYEYETVCGSCHGGGAVGAGMAPDLRASATLFSEHEFAEIVREGSRLSMGMPMYADLDDEQLLALRHYIRRAARY